MDISQADGTAIHFAETHDNPRLAATSPVYARMRTALCALLSNQGGFGFANGVEWLATEKIDVHESPSLNWGATENLVDFIRRLNAVLSAHPAFFHPVRVEMIQQGPGNALALPPAGAKRTARGCWCWSTWMRRRPPKSPGTAAGHPSGKRDSPFDLLSGEPVPIGGDPETAPACRWRRDRCSA